MRDWERSKLGEETMEGSTYLLCQTCSVLKVTDKGVWCPKTPGVKLKTNYINEVIECSGYE